MNIALNKVVSIDYTLTDSEDQVLDTSQGHEPLSYLHGRGHIIPGLEKALEGRSPGDTIKVSIPPEDAYGPRREELIEEIPKDHFDLEGEIQVGMRFQANTDAGVMVMSVTELREDSVVVDANHPLAGETLNFDVTVVDIREATDKEIETGRIEEPLIVAP